MHEEFEGFAYINIDNPMAAWNVVRSNFYSSACLPQTEQAGALSFSMADLLRTENATRALAEFRLEAFRRRYFPDEVSRLTGIFLFDDVDSAAQVWDNDAWSGHFNASYLTDVGASADQSSRLDATWITFMRDRNNMLVEGWEKMAEKYWSGEPATGQPIWERIIEGWVTIWGLDLKQRAFAEIQKFWPHSLSLLEIAANSASIGSCDGATMPYAVQNGEMVEVNYYLRMVDAMEAEFCERLGHFVRTGGDKVCRLGLPFEALTTPDFRCYSFQREIKNIPHIW
ncbi:hypothetical protein [Celeribacter halophilus]|uniref:hypothetical protein n=1 Tax=Celeribacter halophilus TaxID=576117 RepID=UPI003A8EFE72